MGLDEPSEEWHVSPLFAEATPPPPSPPVVPIPRTVSTGPPRQSPELVQQAPQPLDGAKKDALVPELRMALRHRLQTSSQSRGKSQVLEAAAFGCPLLVLVVEFLPPPPPLQ